MMQAALDVLDWPAMAASLIAAYLVASRTPRKRYVGFWVFLLSNVLWVTWGLHTSAWGLITLQFGLAAMNVRGVFKTDQDCR